MDRKKLARKKSPDGLSLPNQNTIIINNNNSNNN